MDNKSLKLSDNVTDAILGKSVNIEDNGTGKNIATILGRETQVWATDGGNVNDGTYLVWVEDVTDPDLQGVRLDLNGPGLSKELRYGPFKFKNDLDNSTTCLLYTSDAADE